MLNKSSASAFCPDCQSNIMLPPKPEMWMRITCPECGTQLEIVDDNPWELDYTDDIEDDDEMFANELAEEEDDFFPEEEEEEDL
jgi:hypothetical protein